MKHNFNSFVGLSLLTNPKTIGKPELVGTAHFMHETEKRRDTPIRLERIKSRNLVVLSKCRSRKRAVLFTVFKFKIVREPYN